MMKKSPPLDPNAEAARRANLSLKHFCIGVRPGFQLARHTLFLIKELEAVERGETKRLMVSCPPRHGKTLLVSQLFPAWFLGRNPTKSVIATSYASDLAGDFGRMTRDIVADYAFKGFFPGVGMSSDNSAAHRFGLSLGGRYFAVGIEGVLTGRGADLFIVDDPIKGPQDAASEVQQRALQNWFESVAVTRLEPGGRIILVQTRWNENDLTGYLLREHANDGWKVVNLPAIAEGPDDLLGREEGEALWPEKYDLDELASKRMEGNPGVWASLYQGRPSPPEGAVFKKDWWAYYDTPPEQFRRITLSLDTAFKTTTSSDYSVCQIWGETHNAFYLRHQWRARVDFPSLVRVVRDLADQWRPHAVVVENAASGQSLIQTLLAETRLNIVPAEHRGNSKEVRANAASQYVQSGKVFLPQNAGWMPDFMDELSTFPNGAHDDCVDALSQFLNWQRETPARDPEHDRRQLEALYQIRLYNL